MSEPRLSSIWCAAALALACGGPSEQEAAPAGPAREVDAVLLITLDTTRADSLGYAGAPVATPNLDRLAGEGLVFERAYTTAPMTLPAHASMLTGELPPGHRVHENSRPLGPEVPLLPELLAERGWSTAAFVSGLPLSRRFGLARGFAHYDDDLGPDAVERRADATTDAAVAALDALPDGPAFLWVHYFDPHEPYDPPSPHRERHPDDPYLGEIAFLDAELGRLVEAFDRRFGRDRGRIVVAADHGEGRGDHGEAYHGNLVYDEVMRVPLLIRGAGIASAVVESPVSVRQIFDTVLAWSGLAGESGEAARLDRADPERLVLGEGMRPYLQYGWRPQVFGVLGSIKAIRSGDLEVYDLAADPGEQRDLAGELELDPRLAGALDGYPIPSESGGGIDSEDRAALARLGYVSWDGEVALQEDAPSPADMTHVFADLDLGSGLFVRGAYAEAIPVFRRVAERDPGNLMVWIRLAVAHSLVGRFAEADRLFARAAEVRPDSVDVRHYRAMHLLRSGRLEQAEPLFEEVVAAMPERLPALGALAGIRERQGRVDEALRLYERVVSLESQPAAALVRIGLLRMGRGETDAAIRAFERAREVAPERFGHPLELGVLYLAAGRADEAAASLDRALAAAPNDPMALFKRAQVAVLRREPDAEERVRRAWAAADATTAPLIRNENLFRGIRLD